MGIKMDLRIGSNASVEDVKTAIMNGITCEYLIDILQAKIRRYNIDTNLEKICDNFRDAIDKSHNVGFSSIVAWNTNKTSAYADMLAIVNDLDDTLARLGKISQGEIANEFKELLTNFILDFVDVEITLTGIDCKEVNIARSYIENTLEELAIIDGTQFLVDLMGKQITSAPLEIEKYRNTFIEQKLNASTEILKYVETELTADYTKLHKQLTKVYDTFYKISYDTLTDGEKFDKARKAIKIINPHRQLLDKLEDRLTEVSELSRQLSIHEKRLRPGLDEQVAGFRKRIAEFPDEKEMFEREIDSVVYVTEDYFKQIKDVAERLKKVKETITEEYKVMDKLEISLKAAIPTEDEMNKYSSIAFKFQDLLVRLELAKSQIADKKAEVDMVNALDSAIMGLGVLVNIAQIGKDIFMRNSMLISIFNSINSMYDLVNNPNKSIEISQIKFVTSQLSEYSVLNATFGKTLVTFRRVGNNAIRDIAMVMGKPFNLDGLADILEFIDVTINQMKELTDSLDNNHKSQTQLLNNILAI